jgi:hypothetical protein
MCYQKITSNVNLSEVVTELPRGEIRNLCSKRVLYIRLIYAGIFFVVSTTVFHFCVWFFSPFESDFPILSAWGLVFCFVSLVVATLLVFARSNTLLDSNPIWRLNVEQLIEMKIGWLFVIACVGLVLHYYAKAYIFELYVQECLASIRHIWIAHDRSSDPWLVRFASQFGYLATHFAMPGLFLTSCSIAFFGCSKKSWLGYVGFSAVIVLFSFPIFSRTVILTALIVSTFGAVLGYLMRARITFVAFVMASLPVLVFCIFALSISDYVFKLRASCERSTVHEYVTRNIKDTGVQFKKTHSDLLSFDSRSITTLSANAHYLNHGIYNFAQILGASEKGPSILMDTLYFYLARFGVDVPLKEGFRIYSLGGATLAGSLYHDLGWLGMLAAALALALMWCAGVVIALRNNWSIWFGITLLVGMTITFSMSLLFVAPSTISFPFTLAAFLVLGLVTYFGRFFSISSMPSR